MFRELAHAGRVILKTPGLSAIAVVSLALGIAANTTIFSLFHSFLLRPLPYADSERLVMVWESQRGRSADRDAASPADFFDWRERASSFDALIAAEFTTVTLSGTAHPEELTVARVSPSFLALLGSEPMLGRAFGGGDGRTGEPPVAIASEGLWRASLGAADGVVGRELALDGEAHTVIGVMPETFDFLLGSVDLWIASDFEERRDQRDERSLYVTGRLRPGVTLEQAQAEMTAIAGRLERLYPETHEGWEAELQLVADVFPGATDTRLAQILMAVVVLVLLVACVNVASLLLAKSDARHKEMSVRSALGAGRGRLLRQLLTEAVVLALVAGALGITLSVWGIRGVSASFPDMVPSFYRPHLAAPVIGFGIVVSVLAGLTFGISPALQALRGNLLAPLLDGTRKSTASRERKRLLSGLVVAELAIALTVLVSAAVLTDVFHHGLAVDPGFDSEGVLTLHLELAEYRFADDAAMVGYLERLEDALTGVGGAKALTFASELPRTRDLPFTDFLIEGRPAERGEAPRTSWLAVQPGYFEAMRIGVREGRGFADGDRAGAPPVIAVNQSWVDLYLAGSGDEATGALGRRLVVEEEAWEIVGVVADVAQARMAGVEPIEPAVYFPFAQHPVRGVYALVRGPGQDAYGLAEPVRRAIWEIDPEQPISRVASLDDHIATQLAGPTTIARVLSAVGLLALALAALGIYGVMTFSVSQQTAEIGIRMALGARPRQILGRVTRQGAQLAGLGLMLGIPASAGAVRWIVTLFEAAASDGINAVGGLPLQSALAVAVLLAAVGLLACYLPARRATRVDPVSALQGE